MRSIYQVSTISLAALFMAACSSPVKVAEQPAAPVATVAKPAPDTRAVAPVTAPVVDPLDDPKNILSKRSVYFDFDKYNVKPEFNALVEAHGKYVSSSKTKKVMIQGNTDERGGSEYNLALGQKRAEAVRKAMVISGAADAQLESVSYGKEKPKAAGHDEAAWAENRRADIVYVAK
ncbi:MULTISPECIES: peptidoglycan-associated lipoprotein Pal [Undibacterium]|uniref:Peptidoglycan-associated lipoprotein n=2 Tax=Undibacterium TaxID=401469 RepID=A0A850QDE8_9BURK|nr:MULTISPECIES: peptidoglycan-associated lipoprotein Pal [Undibacterium]MBC3869745.1 peptidoglycan-associated lipoprotein Pal [Undibacterium oligocarboniphilum]MBC3885234.1 peptidoglycan-associated lipoprotein Pal [Undibacterium griseum]NVO77348.1 peptidoglycan-associated lipoprotein Pal [Undibacterium oligocarboniphilum]